MSIKVMQNVWDHAKAQGTKRLILLAIADCANDEGYAYPSISTITRKCGLKSTRSVQKQMRQLEYSGELVVYERAGNRKQNVYEITIDITPVSKDTLSPKTPRQSRPLPLSSETQNPCPRGHINRKEPFEGTGEKKESTPPPPHVDKSTSDAQASEGSWSSMITRLNQLYPRSTKNLTAQEEFKLKGCIDLLKELSDEDWTILGNYHGTKDNACRRGKKAWPFNRTQFLDNTAEAIDKARWWWEDYGSWWFKNQEAQAKKQANKSKQRQQEQDAKDQAQMDEAIREIEAFQEWLSNNGLNPAHALKWKKEDHKNYKKYVEQLLQEALKPLY